MKATCAVLVLVISLFQDAASQVLFPPWPATYNMAKSTTVAHGYSQSSWPSNETTYADAKYGLVVIDWSMDVLQNSTFQEAKTETYAEQLKKIGGPQTRVFGYRNMELGLSSFSTMRPVMVDPAYSGFWLKCNGTICNAPIPAQNQYFWDYTNQSAGNYFVNTVVGEIASTPNVDGLWFDDRSGLGEEHQNILQYFTPAQIEACQTATTAVFARTKPFMNSINKYNYFSFSEIDGPVASNCAQSIIAANKTFSSFPTIMFLTVGSDNQPSNETLSQQVAAFLLTRGDYAYLGTGWAAGPYWYSEFDVDYGEPLGVMQETDTNIFTRKWSNSVVTLDCNTYTATFSK